MATTATIEALLWDGNPTSTIVGRRTFGGVDGEIVLKELSDIDTFDDSSLDPALWGTSLAATGTVVEGVNGVDINAAEGGGNGAVMFWKKLFDDTLDEGVTRLYQTRWKVNSNKTNGQNPFEVRVDDGNFTLGTNVANRVILIYFFQSNIHISYYTNGGAARWWNGVGSVWQSGFIKALDGALGTEYTIRLETEGIAGGDLRWRILVQTGAIGSEVTQVTTDWVNLSATRSKGGDDFRITHGTFILGRGVDITIIKNAYDTGYATDSPSPVAVWTQIVEDTLIDMSSIHIPENMDSGDSGSVEYKYAKNSGALSASLTQVQLKAEADFTVTNKIQALKIVVIYISDGDQRTSSRSFASVSGAFPDPVACDLPAISDVRFLTVYDNGNKTGSAHMVGASDTRLGVLTDDTVGTLAVAPASDVRENVPTDDTVGNYVPADEDNHALGDSYGANGNEFTGTKALTPYNLPVEVIREDSEILVYEGSE